VPRPPPQAALLWDQVVVLKGAHSVVAEPGGMVLRSDVASAALATAGSGDVLAGVIGAFLAAGCDAVRGGRPAAWRCTGRPGLLAAERIGRAGVDGHATSQRCCPEAIEQLRDGPVTGRGARTGPGSRSTTQRSGTTSR
jgi:hypothetical protein